MSKARIHAFPGFKKQAQALADMVALPVHQIDIHVFPDGESRVRVMPHSGTAIVFVGLDHPNEKLVTLVLAASALREGGASRVVLVCPYLCYMRQDIAFVPGEAVSQRTIGAMLAQYFDRVVTVDPHLHRVASLAEVMPGIKADALSAARLIGGLVASDKRLEQAVLVGPDSESRQWVSVAAASAGNDFLVAKKIRHGDRDVEITLPDSGLVAQRTAVIIDDLISSGATVCRCAELLKAAGALYIEAIAVHVMADQAALDAMATAGVSRVRSSDSIVHSTNDFSLAPLLATVIKQETGDGT